MLNEMVGWLKLLMQHGSMQKIFMTSFFMWFTTMSGEESDINKEPYAN